MKASLLEFLTTLPWDILKLSWTSYVQFQPTRLPSDVQAQRSLRDNATILSLRLELQDNR